MYWRRDSRQCDVTLLNYIQITGKLLLGSTPYLRIPYSSVSATRNIAYLQYSMQLLHLMDESGLPCLVHRQRDLHIVSLFAWPTKRRPFSRRYTRKLAAIWPHEMVAES